jgi:hypothetical protein
MMAETSTISLDKKLSGRDGKGRFVKGHQCSSNERNPLWRGNNAGYHALHIWVRRHLSKPELCQVCKLVPPHDLANVTGMYNREFHNWKYMCRKCHMESDGRMNNLKHIRMMNNLRRIGSFKDMSDRKCSICNNVETTTARNGRPIWRYLDGKLVCHKCCCLEYNSRRRLLI